MSTRFTTKMAITRPRRVRNSRRLGCGVLAESDNFAVPQSPRFGALAAKNVARTLESYAASSSEDTMKSGLGQVRREGCAA